MVAIAIFFAPALIGKAYYSPADILLMWSPFNTPGIPYIPKNDLLSDIVTQMEPWLKFSREQFRAGSFPLWNPHSGAGVPHFANLQSTVLFPLNYLFYFLPWRIALIAAPFIKLYLIGLFTFLYLRAIGLNRGASLFGCLNFAFLGFNVFWLKWPLSNLMIFFPLLLLFAEKFARDEIGKWPLLLLAFSVGAAGLAGHIETLFHILLLAFIYLLWRVLSSGLSWSRCGRSLILFVLFATLGLGMAAVQLVPFLEYMFNSAAYAKRVAYDINPHYLPLPAAILNIIPDFYGNPSHNSYFALFTNYCVSVSGFASVTTVLLALLALLGPPRKSKYVWFFLFMGTACFCLVYKIEPVYRALTSLPLLDIADNSRLLFCLGFSLCVLAAFFIQYLTDGLSRPPHALLVCALTLLLMALAAWLAIYNKGFFETYNLHFRFRHNLPPTLFFLLFLATTSIVLLLCRYGHLSLRRGAIYLGLLVFLQTAVHAIGFNPANPKGNFYPPAPSISFLKSDRSVHRCLFMGNVFFPNLSVWYGIEEPRSYDAMGIKSYSDFQKAMGNYENLFQVVTSCNEDMAGFLNAKYIICEQGFDPRQTMDLRYPDNYELSYSDRSVYICENSACMPRAFLVPRVRIVDSEESLFSELPALDYRSEALVTDRDVPIFQAGDLSHSSCRIRSYQPRRIEISLDVERPCYLVLSDNYFPGWKASIDGRKAKIYKTNGSFRLVPVHSAGRHELVFRYNPLSFTIGIAISLACLIPAVLISRLVSRSAPVKTRNINHEALAAD